MVLSDSLALLLISSEKHDVAATGMILEPGNVRIVWTKNDDARATQKEEAYIHELVSKFAAGASENEILLFVVEHCRQKIVLRLRKPRMLWSQRCKQP